MTIVEKREENPVGPNLALICFCASQTAQPSYPKTSTRIVHGKAAAEPLSKEALSGIYVPLWKMLASGLFEENRPCARKHQ